MTPLAQTDRQQEVHLGSHYREISDEPIAFWLCPQVLSLDAPAVAVTWQWLFARSFHIPVPLSVLFVTGASVWMIYAGDHLLDVKVGAIYSARHRFVFRHLRSYRVALAAIALMTFVAAWHLPPSIWACGVAVAAAVFAYLAAVHSGRAFLRRYWPKEFVVGAVFAIGSSIATWTATSHAWPSITLFAALCIINCSSVDYWEWQRNRVLLRYPHRLTRFAAKHFFVASFGILAFSALVLYLAPNPAIASAGLSAILLIGVGAARSRLSPDAARLLADAALLTPLIFLLR